MTAPFALLFCSLLSTFAPQEPGRTPEKPAIAWQRTLDDALAVQKATGLPLLVAVNMDGEVFNDRFASDTYLDPEFVASTRGYVCVVASPNRHNERDYDAFGRRIECPRFPGCTCSEHINIEPELFRRYFDGKRNAPRHVGVDLQGKILFDRFLDNSMQTAIDAIAKGRGTAKPGSMDPTSDLDQLFQRRDAAARTPLERLYRDGDGEQKRKLLEAAANATNEPFDLLRMALREEDELLFGYGARALASLAGKDALIDLEDALARVEDRDVENLLLARLQQLGKQDPAAARLFSHFDWTADEELPQPWSKPWASATFDANDRASIEAVLDRCEALLKKTPGDAQARLQLATAQAALGEHLAATGGKGVEFWFEDAIQSAKKVTDVALQPEAQAVIAVAAWQRSNAELARTAAVLACSTAKSERQADPWLAARLLDVVVQTTAQAAYGKATAEPTASLRAELQRTALVLQLLEARDTFVESTHLAGIALLEYGSLRQLAAGHLEALVARFPTSAAVHERWRNRLLIDRGAEAMRSRVARFADKTEPKAAAEWFAGYAALVAAEQHVRDQRPDTAEQAYSDAIARFERCAAGNADYADSAHHFTVLALAGHALLRHLAGDGATAVQDLLRAAALRPASLDEQDGLQRKPRALANRISRELAQAGKQDLVEQLKALQ